MISEHIFPKVINFFKEKVLKQFLKMHFKRFFRGGSVLIRAGGRSIKIQLIFVFVLFDCPYKKLTVWLVLFLKIII